MTPRYKKLKLPGDQVCLVDTEDFELVSKYKWTLLNSNGFYARTGTSGNSLLMHRLILKAPKNMIVDHVNHNGLDNRKKNLRICSHIENCRNQKKRADSTYNFKGIQRTKNKKKEVWFSRIKHNGKEIYLGVFNSEIKAARAYNKAAKKYHGRFAYLNKIPAAIASVEGGKS